MKLGYLIQKRKFLPSWMMLEERNTWGKLNLILLNGQPLIMWMRMEIKEVGKVATVWESVSGEAWRKLLGLSLTS